MNKEQLLKRIETLTVEEILFNGSKIPEWWDGDPSLVLNSNDKETNKIIFVAGGHSKCNAYRVPYEESANLLLDALKKAIKMELDDVSSSVEELIIDSGVSLNLTHVFWYNGAECSTEHCVCFGHNKEEILEDIRERMFYSNEYPPND